MAMGEIPPAMTTLAAQSGTREGEEDWSVLWPMDVMGYGLSARNNAVTSPLRSEIYSVDWERMKEREKERTRKEREGSGMAAEEEGVEGEREREEILREGITQTRKRLCVIKTPLPIESSRTLSINRNI
jgi:hypothetical protein